MKSLILFLWMALSLSLTAQTLDSVFVYKSVDEMTDKSYYFPSRKIVCIDEVSNIGFSVTFFLDMKSDSTLVTDDIFVKTANYGCLENVDIIFLFEDGTKINARCWNDFNCESVAYFTISQKDKEALSTKKISKIRVTNNRNMKSYTGIIPDENKDYFIQLFQAVSKKNIHPYTEE